MRQDDKLVDESEKARIQQYARKRLVAECRMGKHSVAGYVDALHATPPTDKEIIGVLTGEGYQEKEIQNAINQIDNIAPNFADNDAAKKRPLSEIAKKSANTVVRRTADLKKIFEDGTREIAEIASRESGSSFVVACSRLIQDWNRLDTTKKVGVIAGESMEHSYESHIVEHNLLHEFLDKQGLLDSDRGLSQPFIHLSIHGCAKRDKGYDIYIANGVKDGGQMPCNPEIARWAMHKINDKLREYNISGPNNRALKVHIAIEGERLSGSTASVRRRWDDGRMMEGWGPLYQYLQVELVPFLRRYRQKEMGIVFAEIIKEFLSVFNTRKAMLDYIEEEKTVIDEERKRGAIFLSNLIISNRVKTGTIRMNYDCRQALGVKVNEIVDIYQVDKGYKLRMQQALIVDWAHVKELSDYASVNNGDKIVLPVIIKKESDRKRQDYGQNY